MSFHTALALLFTVAAILAFACATLIYFSPSDNSDAAALKMIPVLAFAAVGVIFAIVALVARLS